MYEVPLFLCLLDGTARQDSSILLWALPWLALQHPSAHFCIPYNKDNTCTAPCVYFLHRNANWNSFLCTGRVSCVGCDVHILVTLESSSFQEMPTSISFEQSQFQNVRNSENQHLWKLNFISCQASGLQNLSHTVCQMEELHPVKNQHSTRFPAKWVQTNLSACT